jgi:UDP-N-acetylglucosamine 2-epimerase (hydrolysing)
MSHIHFVANKKAKQRLIQMGEKKDTIFIIGSPDIDVMLSDSLPLLSEVKKHYEISFNTYSIFCYHPVTTELDKLETNIKNTVSALIESNKNYVVIYPNNDPGSDIILNAILTLKEHKNFRILPSMRFEYFLTLLKNCEFIIGNSSSGIRGAGLYGVPAINIGTRQMNRSENKSIINVTPKKDKILQHIQNIEGLFFEKTFEFGQGNSTELFYKTLKKKNIWKIPHQKQFIDQEMNFKEDFDSVLEIDLEK